jgi:hypothetical protein
MEVVGIEGLIAAIVLLISPFIILAILLRLLPAGETENAEAAVSS